MNLKERVDQALERINSLSREQFRVELEEHGMKSVYGDGGICMLNYLNQGCDAKTDDLVRDGWYAGYIGEQAYWVCPDHKDQVLNPELIAPLSQF